MLGSISTRGAVSTGYELLLYHAALRTIFRLPVYMYALLSAANNLDDQVHND